MEKYTESKLASNAVQNDDDNKNNDGITLFDDIPNQKRLLSVYDASSTPSLPTLSRSTTDDDSSKSNDTAKFYRKAFVEVPVTVSEEKGIALAPNARLSMNSTFPISSKSLTGRLQASAIVRGYTGYTTQDASVKYDASKKTSIQTGLSAVRNRYKVYVDGTTKIGRTGSSSLSARYSQIPTTAGLRGAQFSLTGSQAYSMATVSSTCTVPFSRASPTTLSVGVSSKTRHHWRIGLGWNDQLQNRLSWNLSASPTVSDLQTLRLSIGQMRHGVWTFSANLLQKIRSKNSLGISISYNNSQGALWIFSWSNGELSLNVPISFLDFYDAWAALAFTVMTKVIQDAVALSLRLNTFDVESDKEQMAQSQAKQASASAEALDQQDLMKRQAKSRMTLETENMGLVIHSATYFLSGSPDPTTTSFDVTIPLQFWVINGTLELPAGSKKSLLGFFDITTSQSQKDRKVKMNPIFSKKWWAGFVQIPGRAGHARAPRPMLRVIYEFRGNQDEVVVGDDEKLMLPRQS